jgi:hypothetical protein
VKLIYFIAFYYVILIVNRDNLDTDIFGANLYNRYLTRHQSCRSIAAVVNGRGMKTSELQFDVDSTSDQSAEECYSILVQVS